jgi:hypothetical protein
MARPPTTPEREISTKMYLLSVEKYWRAVANKERLSAMKIDNMTAGNTR